MPDGNPRPSSANMDMWNRLAPVDRKYTKKITGKSYQGDSPNPTYVIQKITEVLGPIGQKWGFEVKFDRVRLGKPHQIVIERAQDMAPMGANGEMVVTRKSERFEIVREEYHEVCITFWQILGETQMGDPIITRFDAFGGTPMLYLTKKGEWMHDEDAAKKSLTDAYTKGASWLGSCADIFLGLFDDKYTSQPRGADNWDDPKGAGGNSQAPEGDDTKKTPPAQRQSSAGSGW